MKWITNFGGSDPYFWWFRSIPDPLINHLIWFWAVAMNQSYKFDPYVESILAQMSHCPGSRFVNQTWLLGSTQVRWAISWLKDLTWIHEDGSEEPELIHTMDQYMNRWTVEYTEFGDCCQQSWMPFPNSLSRQAALQNSLGPWADVSEQDKRNFGYKWQQVRS